MHSGTGATPDVGFRNSGLNAIVYIPPGKEDCGLDAQEIVPPFHKSEDCSVLVPKWDSWKSSSLKMTGKFSMVELTCHCKFCVRVLVQLGPAHS